MRETLGSYLRGPQWRNLRIRLLKEQARKRANAYRPNRGNDQHGNNTETKGIPQDENNFTTG